VIATLNIYIFLFASRKLKFSTALTIIVLLTIIATIVGDASAHTPSLIRAEAAIAATITNSTS